MTNKLSINTDDYHGFIFDMDGLLLDTERICWECFQNACRKFGLYPDFSIYKLCLGRKAQEGNKLLAENFKGCSDFSALNEEWAEKYKDHIENNMIPVKKGVRKSLEFLSGKNIPLGVATSTERKTALKKLSKTDLYGYFSIIVTGDDVKNSKPDPEIYILASKMLKIDPENCIAFEDSDNGVISAVNAGIRVIQIPDMIEPSDDIRLFGHSIVNSFNDIELI